MEIKNIEDLLKAYPELSKQICVNAYSEGVKAARSGVIQFSNTITPENNASRKEREKNSDEDDAVVRLANFMNRKRGGDK